MSEKPPLEITVTPLSNEELRRLNEIHPKHQLYDPDSPTSKDPSINLDQNDPRTYEVL
ncbi:hypothetical protein GOV12_05770 [Candidatus Pacearchaeota archaeon]|nr:hypothetical protein [Candidatus Pacearchaeota archaeon]